MSSEIGWPRMADTASRLEEIQREAEQAAAGASTREELEELRVRYLGRKSELTTALRSIGELPVEERGKVGQTGNKVRTALEELIGSRIQQLEDAELQAKL